MNNFIRLAGIGCCFLTIAGCGGDRGCTEDYFTPDMALQLAAIERPETLLMASILAGREWVREKDPDVALPKAEDLIAGAMKLAPDDEMVLTFAGYYCMPNSRSSDLSVCSRERAQKRTELNPENGFHWANLAHYQRRDGETEAALRSYQRAAAAPDFSIGWGEQVYRFSMAAKAAIPNNEACALEVGTGAATSSLPAFQEFTDICRAHLDQEAWRNVCLDLGRSMVNRSRTMISRSIGFALQRIVHEAVGNDAELSAIEARKAQSDLLVQQHSSVYECKWEDLDWINQWLISIRDYGEMETIRRFSETVSNC